ncbi:MAG: LysM peptidoglycan-binding domain-containing protein, partial [Betaproteobacteria bacterium]|nr:LysM peptidoglycan-binding domain-containing protein [Betaproteobacteria bacterium]
IASTGAALDYLEKLFDMQGDWHLALASYNWGENAVKRAVDRNQSAGLSIDYAKLTMPRETRQYVPKLLALKKIIAHPDQYGLMLEPIPNEPYFATVDMPRAIDVHFAAKLAEMTIDDFVALNPGYSRPLIPSSLDYPLILPADKVPVFRANLANHDDSQLTSWQTYRPKPGESLQAVARKFKLSLSRLKEVNGITRRMRSTPSIIVVPLTSAAATLRLPIMYAPPIQAPTLRLLYHIVNKGDTLGAIARRYRVGISDLRRWNPDLNLSVGHRVRLHLRRSGRRGRGARRQASHPQ